MQKGSSQLAIIWLMLLIMLGITAWFYDIAIVSYICGLAFVLSVMQYVNRIEAPVQSLSAAQQIDLTPTSKIPLYLCSILGIIAASIDSSWLLGLAISAWIFFFLRWLQRLEMSLKHVQQRLHQFEEINTSPSRLPEASLNADDIKQNTEQGLLNQIQIWIFQGNPVLKVAVLILVIGLILLLRYATENWQLSLAFKLCLLACAGVAVTVFGYFLHLKSVAQKQSFAIAVQALGLASLFLTLFFAYYNLLLPHLWWAAGGFVLIQAATLVLSLKQQSVELAIMAMLVAYLAPFSLPFYDATAVELVAYYWLINLGVAVLSSLRPWKYLNQLSFLVTLLVAGLYGLIHFNRNEVWQLSAFILLHSAVFIWLSFRFSQLAAKTDLQHFQLKPVLDLALIFAAPLSAYACLYVLHLNDRSWQIGLSLCYAAVFALCWQLALRSRFVAFIAQSYFSLMLIFLAFIPPILLPDAWSVVGWAVEGVLIFVWALHTQSKVSRYLAMALLSIAALSSFIWVLEGHERHHPSLWVLGLSYLAVVFAANLKPQFQQQLATLSVVFLSAINVLATLCLFTLLQDDLKHTLHFSLALLILVMTFTVMNEGLGTKKTSWTWLIPKWSALSVLLLLAAGLALERSQNSMIVWQSATESLLFAVIGLLLAVLWLRPIQGISTEKEWLSFGGLSSLALVGLSILGQMPYVGLVICPLLFCAWCWFKAASDWAMFWQARSTLLLMSIWLLSSQLFSQQAFVGYVLPILNPFDAMSIAMLCGFLWMLTQQFKAGRDRGLVAVLMLLGLLWLSSYIVLRALHWYLDTPLNHIALWSNSVIQLSLTLLWVTMAWFMMWIATVKQLKSVWLLGGSILLLVSLKLVLFDLAHIGTLTRVLSFLLAGGVMLLIAYIAPMPESNYIAPKN